jgi:hypothetical protein
LICGAITRAIAPLRAKDFLPRISAGGEPGITRAARHLS